MGLWFFAYWKRNKQAKKKQQQQKNTVPFEQQYLRSKTAELKKFKPFTQLKLIKWNGSVSWSLCVGIFLRSYSLFIGGNPKCHSLWHPFGQTCMQCCRLNLLEISYFIVVGCRQHITSSMVKKSTQSTLPLLILLCDVPNSTYVTEKVLIRCVGVALDKKAYIFRLKHVFVIILPLSVVKKAFYVYYYDTLNANFLMLIS